MKFGKRIKEVVWPDMMVPEESETDKQIAALKKELGKEKYNEIVVRAFVESILKESPIVKEMQGRIRDLEALCHKHD